MIATHQPPVQTTADPALDNPVSRRTSWRARTLRLVVLAALATALVVWIDLASVWRAIASMPPLAVLLALGIATADRFAMGIKWRQLIVAGGGTVRVWPAVSAYYQSAISSRMLPVALGSDLLRAYLLSRAGVAAGLVTASVTLEKLIALLSNVLLATLGMLYLVNRIEPAARGPLLLALLIAVAAGTAGLGLALFRPAHALGGRILRRWAPAKLFAILRRSSASLLAYRSHPGRLGINLLLAVGEQCLQFAKFFVLGRALGIAIPTLPFCAGIAVVMFARRVTGYLESLGLSEGVSVLLFTVLGVGKDTAVALALANYAVTTVAMLPGAYLLYRNIPQIRRSISTESVSSPATARKE